MIARPLSYAVLAAAGALALSACGDANLDAEEETGPAATPRIEARFVDGYSELGGGVVDIALIPNAQPFLSRGLAVLDTGGYGLIDFAQGETSHIAGPLASSLVAAPDFQLRGSPAPLVIAAGGDLGAPRAYVFLAEDGELVDLPMDPIAASAPVRGVCAERITEALVDLLVITDEAVEHWRVSDRGEEQLSAQLTDTTPTERPIVACATVNGEIVGVAENGVTRTLGDSTWGFQDAADVAGVEESDGWWAIVTRPAEGGASLVSPLAESVDVSFLGGFNTPDTTAPNQVTASTANFGGSFSGGVVVITQDDRVNVLDLAGLVASAKDALRTGS